MRKLLNILFCLFLFHFNPIAQDSAYTLQDTLRGSLTPERAWWDVTKYDITIFPVITEKLIRGQNTITFRALSEGKRMQVDMQVPMEITGVKQGSNSLFFKRSHNLYYIDFSSVVKKGTVVSITIDFEGTPREAINPPWDGGWIWEKDDDGNPWITVACQVLGASVWYPCKDYQGDEPDSATLNIIVPDTLVAVGNGRLRNRTSLSDAAVHAQALAKTSLGYSVYSWAVVNPINNYNIIPYIGKYVNWKETVAGEKGTIDISYWVLKGDEKKAREQFKQVAPMLKCFEHWFGPYPFYEDSYKLIHSPHLGMEHQSGIAYGNQFMNGYLGKDISASGWGKKWDFIIIHESGHEWFGNNITTKDVADMWVHEGFTNYSEALFTECEYGKQAGNEYCIGLRRNIQNDRPLIAAYGVNQEGSTDMYYKGANLVHMIRQLMDDDEKFRKMLRSLNKEFYHSTVTTQQIQKYISKCAGKDLSKVFDQYLKTTQIPELEYTLENGTLKYRWTNCLAGFDMPLKIITDKNTWIYPTGEWKSVSLGKAGFKVDPNFYVGSRKI